MRDGAIHLPGRLVTAPLGGRLPPRRSLPEYVARARARLSSKDTEGHAVLDHIEYSSTEQSPAPVASTLSNAADAASGTGMSDCAALYAKAMCNPFGTFDTLPCVPCTPPLPSQRFKSLKRGTFVTGTAQNGFLLVAPYQSANNGNKTIATTTTYAGSMSTAFASGASAPAAADPGFPFTSANLSNGVDTRLVACGVRWRNISAAGTVCGITAAVQISDDLSATDFTPNDILAMKDAVITPAALQPVKIGQEQNTWTTFLWRPKSMTSLDASVGGPNGAFTMVVLAIDDGTNQQTYEYELITFVEYSGVAVTGGVVTSTSSLVVSDADEVGLDRVLQGLQRAPLDLSAGSWAEQEAIGIVDAMAHSDTTARTTEALTGGGGLGIGKIVDIASSLLGFFLA